MVDLLLGIQIAGCFILTGFLIGDWRSRLLTITKAADAAAAAEDMVRRMAEVDASRTAKLLEHDDAIQSLRLRLDAANKQHGRIAQ